MKYEVFNLFFNSNREREIIIRNNVTKLGKISCNNHCCRQIPNSEYFILCISLFNLYHNEGMKFVIQVHNKFCDTSRK